MPARGENQVVLKYCEVIDEFIKVRVFSDEDVAQFMKPDQITNRRAYQRQVVESAVVDYAENVLPLFKKFNRIYKPEALEDVLYQICVEVNPHLEIHQVSLPLHGENQAELDDAVQLRRKLKDKVVGLERALMQKVVGQNEAVMTISKAIKKAAVGLKDPRKPIGCFLMVGTTGSGKTELAKVIAKHLFGKSSNMVRVDCSEFALPHEYAKLIGAPPGYIGHNEGGYLTEAVKTKKQCVVLFDEIEKAHNKIHNLLLQLMDEGTLTDGKGNTVRFDNTLVLLTSNLGVAEVEAVKNRCGFDSARRTQLSKNDQNDAMHAAVKSNFPPEFVNRLDDVIVFNQLTQKDCERISRLLLDEVAEYLSTTGIKLRFANKLDSWIAAQGFDPEYGARELRRIIKTEVEAPLAELLIDGNFDEGDSIQITVRRDRVVFDAERKNARSKRNVTALLPAPTADAPSV